MKKSGNIVRSVPSSALQSRTWLLIGFS